MNKKYILFLSVLIVTIDQIIKKIICKYIPVKSSRDFLKNAVRLTNVHNKGMAFSFGSKSTIAITLITAILLCLLVYFLLKKYEKINTLLKISFSMVIGGGIGNLADRVFRGYVVDYIDINNIFKYPIFNFADICIVVGIIFIIINLIIETIKEKE